MSDHPILFSAPMVRAVLDGRKTMTRRVLKPQPVMRGDNDCVITYERGKHTFSGPPDFLIRDILPTYGLRWRPGDRLWVREGFALVGTTDPGFLLYRASGYEAECARHGFDSPYPSETIVRWRPSIHMPRWASRITLAVEAVRVERLHDITEGDAIAEGMVWRATTPEDIAKDHEYCRKIGVQPHKYLGDGAWTAPGVAGPNDGPWGTTAREAFCALWGSLHGADAWNTNPWVGVTTFRRIEA